MDKILQQIEKFHGHLGPYVVLGYKMGNLANTHLGIQPFSKHATVWTGTTPPVSCIIDGIQLSSGCTLGTGKITVFDKKLPKAKFTNKSERTMEITVKASVQKEIEQTVTRENMKEYSKQLFQKPDDELFEINL